MSMKQMKINKKSINLTDEEKRQFLEEHFSYEVIMLSFSANKLIEFNCIKDTYCTNMALETFLFHARNLMEFFYYDKKYPTDARAYDFLKDKAEWEKIKPKETDSIEKIKDRSGKEIAHLTYKRIYGTPPEKKWDCSEIRKDILKIVNIFLDHLPEKYMGDRLRDIKENTR